MTRPSFVGAITGSSIVDRLDFNDLELDGIDMESIEIVQATDTTAAPAHGASSRSWGLCSCSCSISCIEESF